MLDEIAVVSRLYREPKQDAGAQERARIRLEEAIASERVAVGSTRRRSRLSLWIGIAAAVVVGALVIQFLSLGSGSESPTHDAASALRSLAGQARTSTLAHRGSGLFLLSKSDNTQILTKGEGTVSNVDATTGESFDLQVVATQRLWVHPDGSASRQTTVKHVTFRSQSDQETWQALGQPPIPEEGDVHLEDLGATELTPYDLGTLPTDPERLETALRTPSQGPGQLDDQQVTGQILTILSVADPSSELRSALLRVLSDLPGVISRGTVQDPSGRSGEGFTFPLGAGAKDVIFDPKTTMVLSVTSFNPEGAVVDSVVYQPPTLVDHLPAGARTAAA